MCLMFVRPTRNPRAICSVGIHVNHHFSYIVALADPAQTDETSPQLRLYADLKSLRLARDIFSRGWSLFEVLLEPLGPGLDSWQHQACLAVISDARSAPRQRGPAHHQKRSAFSRCPLA